MYKEEITNLAVLKAFRQCAHFQWHRVGRFQGQGRLLILLSRQESMTQKELADITQRRSATLSEQLELMEKGGLIIREKNPNDKRNVDIRLTQKGREAAVEAENERVATADTLFSVLEDEEKEQFYRTLGKLIEAWKQEETVAAQKDEDGL